MNPRFVVEGSVRSAPAALVRQSGSLAPCNEARGNLCGSQLPFFDEPLYAVLLSTECRRECSDRHRTFLTRLPRAGERL